MGKRGRAPSGLGDDGLLVAVRRGVGGDGEEWLIFLVDSVARGSHNSVPDEKEVFGDAHDSEDDRPVSRAAASGHLENPPSHGRFTSHHLTPASACRQARLFPPIILTLSSSSSSSSASSRPQLPPPYPLNLLLWMSCCQY